MESPPTSKSGTLAALSKSRRDVKPLSDSEALMLGYIVRRVLLMIPTLFLVSVVSFVAIQLPPGDYLTTYASQLASQGESNSNEAIEALRVRYGLGEPVEVQYVKWVTG